MPASQLGGGQAANGDLARAQAFWLSAALKVTALPVDSKGASHQFDPRFSLVRSKMYSSIKPFIHGAATEKQLELMPPRRVSPPESLVSRQTGKFPNNKMEKKKKESTWCAPFEALERKPQGPVLPSHTRGLLEPAGLRLT